MKLRAVIVRLQRHDLVHAHVVDTDDLLEAVIELGELIIRVEHADQLTTLGMSCLTAAAELRRTILERWAETFPELPPMLGHGGRCDSCGLTAEDLYRVAMPSGSDGEEREPFEACSRCAGIEQAAA